MANGLYFGTEIVPGPAVAQGLALVLVVGGVVVAGSAVDPTGVAVATWATLWAVAAGGTTGAGDTVVGGTADGVVVAGVVVVAGGTAGVVTVTVVLPSDGAVPEQ